MEKDFPSSVELDEHSSTSIAETKMGEFRFRLPDDWMLATRQIRSIHVVGLDGIPWPCKSFCEGKTLILRRNQDGSGHIFISYPFSERGEINVSTGTLLEQPEPYDLATELARGTLNRLRNQISIWEEGGLTISDDIRSLTVTAIEQLGASIMSPNYSVRDEMARKSLENSLQAIFDLSAAFGKQVSAFRRNHLELAKFWMAIRCGKENQLGASLAHQNFEMVQVDSQSLKQIGERSDRRLILGPLLDASAGGMSEHLINLDDFRSRKDQLLIEARQAVTELPSFVSLLHVVSGLNGLGHRHLSYPQQLQVTIDMIQQMEELVDTPMMVSFDFPWAERMASSVGGIHPLQIADSLLRQGLSISYLGLDVNLDYWPNGSVIRDPLQWIDIIDVWSQLGLPLVVNIRAPSGAMPQERGSTDGLVNEVRSNLSDQQRLEFMRRVLPMIIARPNVHGMIWTQWQDGDDFRYPNGGLFGADGGKKEMDQVLVDMRSEFIR